MQEVAPPTLDLELFLPLVGEAFAVDIIEPEPLSILLELAKATPQHALRVDPFVLHFTGAGPLCLQQGTHRLSHPTLGTFDLFLVPVAQHGERFAYQAIFN